jgi:hypothetical protein
VGLEFQLKEMNPAEFLGEDSEPNSPEVRRGDSPYGASRGNGYNLQSIPEVMTASHGYSKQESFISIDNRSKRSMRKRKELPFNPLRFMAQLLLEKANEKAAIKAAVLK